jgi:hypothetical protein
VSEGFQTWAEQFLVPDGRVWIGSRRFANFFEVAGGSITVGNSDSPTILLPTAGGTNIPQKFYRGPKAPKSANFRNFGVGFIGDAPADFDYFKLAQARGVPQRFFPGYPEIEVWDVISGQTYNLRRLPWNGIIAEIPGVLEDEDMPITFLLDEEADPAAASVSGQVVTALETGELAVKYYPIYQMTFGSVADVVEDSNSLVCSCTLNEAVMKVGS